MEKKTNKNPGFQNFYLEFAIYIYMKQRISIEKKEDPRFDNFYLNFEASILLGNLSQFIWQRIL